MHIEQLDGDHHAKGATALLKIYAAEKLGNIYYHNFLNRMEDISLCSQRVDGKELGLNHTFGIDVLFGHVSHLPCCATHQQYLAASQARHKNKCINDYYRYIIDIIGRPHETINTLLKHFWLLISKKFSVSST